MDLGALVQSVNVRTNIGGVTVEAGGAAAPEAPGSFSWARLLQPAVTVQLAGGAPVNVAPWGEPAPGREWVLPAVAILLVSGLVGLGWWMGRAGRR